MSHGSPTNQIARQSSSPPWRTAVLLGVGYFLCAWLSRLLCASGGTVVSYWLPGGLFVSVLLLNATRDWPWLMLAAALGNALFDLLHDPRTNFMVIALFCVANVVQSGSGAWLVRRWVAEQPALRSLKEFFGLMFFAGMAGPGLGATIGAAMLTGFHVTNSFVQEWIILWSGGVMAVLVMAPLLLVFFGAAEKTPPERFTWPRLLEGVLILGGLGFYLWAVMVRGGGINSPKAPALIFVLWAAVRFRLRGGALAVFVLALWLAFLTTHYLRGLSAAAIASGAYVLTLQIFVVMVALVGLVPAIVLSERDRAQALLRESEEKFSKAFRASPDSMSVTEIATGRFIEVNESYCHLYGYRREEMIGQTALELGVWDNPQDRGRFMTALKAGGGVRNFEARAHTRAGGTRIVLLSGEAIELAGTACVVCVLHDITERILAEAERDQTAIREQQARMEYTLRLIAAQEAERKRIASELHDSMGQNLLLIKNLAEMSLRSRAPEQMSEQTVAIKELAVRCIAEARQISRDLHPHQLEHLGLKRALEVMVEQAAQASAIQFTFKFEPVDDLFSGDAAMNLYRIVQESLNNILKHSQARRAHLRLERDLHEVQLRIEDDGAGFDLEQAGEKKGLGLQNIAERVRMLGGKLSLVSAPGAGARLEVTIPVAEAAPQSSASASSFP